MSATLPDLIRIPYLHFCCGTQKLKPTEHKKGWLSGATVARSTPEFDHSKRTSKGYRFKSGLGHRARYGEQAFWYLVEVYKADGLNVR
jgi:hypothetical protein